MTKPTLSLLATIFVSALIFSSLAVLQPHATEITVGASPTPYSADHARAQATARDDAEPAPTF